MTLGSDVEFEIGKALFQIELRKERRSNADIIVEVPQNDPGEVQKVKPIIQTRFVIGKVVLDEKIAERPNLFGDFIE